MGKIKAGCPYWLFGFKQDKIEIKTSDQMFQENRIPLKTDVELTTTHFHVGIKRTSGMALHRQERFESGAFGFST